MTMNFFKKVMTFFSTIWNAILWRKTDKKAKQAAKHSKEQDLEGEVKNESATVSEVEKLFVDIPLNPPEGLLEKELFISDEVPDTLTPTVGHNTESRPVSDFGIKKYSSGVQLFGFEDEPCQSLSFFSEPTRDVTESKTPLLSSKTEHCELSADENAASETLFIGEETADSEETAVDEAEVNQVDEVYSSQVSVELPTPPSDSISICEEDFHDQKDFSESIVGASSSDKVPSSSCEEKPVTILNKVLLETQPSLENLSCTTNPITVFRKSSINPDLSYLAIGNEIHLFDHDGVPESFHEEIEDCEKNETAQEDEPLELFGSDPISTWESSEMLETAAAISVDVKINENAATSSSQAVPIGVSVSSTKSTSETNEQALNSTREYSTNYMVKSDSLVNFLPESVTDFDDENDDVFDNAKVLLETAEKLINHEEEKEIFLNCSPLLKEGDMEEMMCTPKGILKLSGDHHFECTDENDGASDDPKEKHVKAAVDDFLLDAFIPFEEPILSTQHLEASVLEETPLESDTDDSPLFREIMKTVETGLEDSDHERGTELDTIGRCRSVIINTPHLSITPNRSRKVFPKESSKPENNEKDDCTHEKSCDDISMEISPQPQVDGDMNDFYPFIDCSSYLFRIPEEIRKETSFNPCVGAAPSRRTSNSANIDSVRYDGDVFENKYQNMNSLVPDCVASLPMVNPCVPEDYKNPRMAKLQDGYNPRSVSQTIDPFWGDHLGIAHPGDHQEAIVGYPVMSCDNYYEGEDLNVPVVYENDNQTNICSDTDGYGYINPYGAAEFPLLSIPLCAPHSQPAFMSRGPLSPIIFPINPMNVTQNPNLNSMVNMEAPSQNEQYTIPLSWRSYSANMQNDEEKEITSMVEVRGLAPISENLSCTGTHDEDDDFDDNPIPDQYFQSLADNNSLHTVKSKADSYSGSLFCESLRSLISHNTENENIFPSFSCSSVQGCCPSVVLQSCETTVSNDSLPSIIVEETNYSKSVDEDYLATEKFMNDVNTALNESVFDQIQGRMDLHTNLLGRGDGSLPVGADHPEDHMETPENDVMLRNSLGENISINNSKLTLLDGVLGTDNDGSHPDPLQNLWEIDSESSGSASNYCRGVLDSLVENVMACSIDQHVELQVGITHTDADCRDDLDESLHKESPERDLIVQNMMFIEGVPAQVKEMWAEGLTRKLDGHEPKEKNVRLEGAVEVGDSSSRVLDETAEEALKKSADTVVDNSQSSAADDFPSRKGRRNRRRRKKLSDVESEVELDPRTEAPGIAIGDGVSHFQDLLMEPNGEKAEQRPSCPSKPRQSEPDTPKPEADGEPFAKCEQDVTQFADGGDEHLEEDEEPGGSSGNPPNNRRRRNRRKKRKN